jgi:hypothetical protein
MIRTQQPRILNKLVPMTPLELFKTQVRNNYEMMRYTAKNMSYTPMQFGGLAGQRILLQEPSVMEVIEFEVT